MNKCSKCGTEFEGNCCPECGTWASGEKPCPKCGTKLTPEAKFCTNCGYSFLQTEEKPKQKRNSVLTWIKSHLKLVIALAIVAVVIIVLSCSIPACIAAQTNGTYYKLKSDGELDKENYFILNSGKWEDDDGASGIYKKDGDKLIFFVEFFGETEKICDGTVANGVLKIKDPLGTGAEDTYISENHKHKFGEWETTQVATCSNDGIQTRVCDCGNKESQAINPLGHDFQNNICTRCKEYALKLTLSTDNKYYTVTGHNFGTNLDIELTIPSYYNGKPVTSIGGSAFCYCSGLTSVTIPDSVTSIGGSAFEGCSGLTSVTIPDSVTSIGAYAFYNCSGLTSVTIPDSVTSIGASAFRGCSGLTSVTIPDSVTSIGASAFEFCRGLTSVTIPDSVTSIGGDAFYGCSSLTSITIPDSVTSIGGSAFYDTDYYNNTNNWKDNVLYIGKHLIAVNEEITGSCIIKQGTLTMSTYAFKFCSGLTSVTIPDSVTSIGAYAFEGCSGLTSVTIPDSVTSIGASAFSNCAFLTSVTIGNSVTSIGGWAFEYCSRLTSITIPDSVTSIGRSAFCYCSGLKDINFKGTKAQWNKIEKGSYWNSNTGDYTVHCTDGDIKKS